MTEQGPWFERPYGRNSDGAWEEARDQCRTLLKEWAKRHPPYFGTYKEVAEHVIAVPWPEGDAFRGQIGWLLGQVSFEEARRGKPLLSALVVNADTRKPGSGLFDLARDELGLNVGRSEREEDSFWLEEAARCRQYWQTNSE
jgi:hypothetical protein